MCSFHVAGCILGKTSSQPPVLRQRLPCNMVLEPPSGDCEGPSRWMHIGSRESKEELTISCRDSTPVGSGSVPRETPISAELRIVSLSPELCVPLPPGTEPASRQTRTTAGSEAAPFTRSRPIGFP